MQANLASSHLPRLTPIRNQSTPFSNAPRLLTSLLQVRGSF